MKHPTAASLLFTVAAASVTKRHACSYKFTAVSESLSGPLTQIPDGQIQLKQHAAPCDRASFTLEHGKMFDKDHKGCIITEPQKQIQCDMNNPGQTKLNGLYFPSLLTLGSKACLFSPLTTIH